MNRSTCTNCGLVNFATTATCRRCAAPLVPDQEPVAHDAPPEPSSGTRSVGRSVAVIVGVTMTILIAWHASLLVSSNGLSDQEDLAIVDAIAVLDRAGFTKNAFVLRHLVSFRSTDNWWNAYVGHQTAYAATNFPFGVVTLYPAFFKYPVDDVERATILLHESYHLLGDGEDAALRQVWIDKQRLGWTVARYGHTRVWKNTREWTAGSVPVLFRCGADGQSDCLE